MEKICNMLQTGTHNLKSITEEIKKLNSNDLSYLQYYAQYCISQNKGRIDIAKLILQYLNDIYINSFKGTVTLTFGDVAESHVGMQKLGKMADHGFSIRDLEHANRFFKQKGCETMIIKLNDFLPNDIKEGNDEEKLHLTNAKTNDKFEAYVFVARNALKHLINDDNGNKLLTEMLFFEWDTRIYNAKKKVVQNKNARYNLNFDDKHQIANFKIGNGTTISWQEVPILHTLRSKISEAFGPSAKNLKCEGNLYTDITKHNGIGRHGDSERKKVIGVRLGRKMNMHWTWFYNNRPRGHNVSIFLNPGDIYCMSEKTVGTDWMLAPKKQYTLRHCAGASKYTTETPTIKIVNQRLDPSNPNITIGDIMFKQKKGVLNPKPQWIKSYN
jgi:hypothetical protein